MLSAQIREALQTMAEVLQLDGDSLVQDWGQVAQAHGWAMASAQVMELAVRMASVATRELAQEDAPAEVQLALRRWFGEAVKQLGTAWPSDLALPTSLLDDLDKARQRRNELAHEFWVMNFGRLLSDTAALTRELEEDSKRFETLTNQLVDSVYVRALSHRDIDAEQFLGFVQLLVAAHVLLPEGLADIRLIGEGERLLERLETLLPQVVELLPPGSDAHGTSLDG